MRRRLALLLVSLATGTALGAPPRRVPPLLFGGGAKSQKREVAIDPSLPTGGALPQRRTPPALPLEACSWRWPVCVHAADPASVSPSLAAIERAYESLTRTLGLPGPRPSDQSERLDFYLDTAATELEVRSESLAPGEFDSSAVHCVAPPRSGAALDRVATLCVGEAIAAALDAGEPSDLRRAFATELWWITGVVTGEDVEAVAAAQARPDAPLLSTEPQPPIASAALLLEYLERNRSAASPGKLSASLVSAAASRTAPEAVALQNEPDVFDVLRHSLDESPAAFADLLSDFSLARATLGTSAETALGGLSFAGQFGRAAVDWSIPFSTLPRRVLSGRPIAPTGSELARVELDEVPLGASLGFRAEWEGPVAFHFRMLLLDADGRELSRIDVPFQERATRAEARVTKLVGGKTLVISGVNQGAIELAHPFDPDVAPFEPSACTLYLARL